ncbi:hypothetical protein RU639_011021 [Aspergillus parasiticus]
MCKFPVIRDKTQREKKASSNHLNILNFLRHAEEAAEIPELLEAGCITAREHFTLTEAVAEDASESKKAKAMKREPVEYPDNDLSPKYTLPDIFESQVSLNPRTCANILLIDNKEFPDELKYGDAAGYNNKIENNLPEQDHQEPDYLEVEGLISDKTRYRAASIAFN